MEEQELQDNMVRGRSTGAEAGAQEQEHRSKSRSRSPAAGQNDARSICSLDHGTNRCSQVGIESSSESGRGMWSGSLTIIAMNTEEKFS